MHRLTHLDQSIPNDLPPPEDDGACKHLTGLRIPSLALPATLGTDVDPSLLTGLTVLLIYPRTAAPDEHVPESWNAIPGARGCTPQACAFRDKADEFLTAGVSNIFGISTQNRPYQQEVKARLHLPYQLLSDESLNLCRALQMPTFDWKGEKVMARVTLVVLDGKIIKSFYPVFPPDRSASQVLNWFQTDYTGRQTLSTGAENQMMRNLQHRTSAD